MADRLKFNQLVIALSGNFPDTTHAELKEKIERNGATFSAKVDEDCTHLVTTQAEVNRKSSKYVKANSLSTCHIVSFKWLQASISIGAAWREWQYEIRDQKPKKLIRNRVFPFVMIWPDYTQPADTQPDDTQPLAVETPLVYYGVPLSNRLLKLTILKRVKRFPADDPEGEAHKKLLFDLGETTPFTRVDAAFSTEVPDFANPEVYIDYKGVVFDAILYDTLLTGQQIFCRIQLLVGQNGHVMTFIRQGTVDTNGESTAQNHADLQAGMNFFLKTFFDETGLTWDDRLAHPRHRKLDFLDGDYAADSPVYKSEEEARLEFDADIPPPLQDLLSCMFDRPFFKKTLQCEIAFETSARKLEFIQLSSVNSAFDILKEIAEGITLSVGQRREGMCSFDEALVSLTDRYREFIPACWGPRPNVIRTMEDVKYEIDTVMTLLDMSAAEEIMSGIVELAGPRAAMEMEIENLPMKEIVALDHSSTEFKELETYLQASRGITHDIEFRVLNIFRIERRGEERNFRKSKFANLEGSDRRLLWRGSRVVTYGGILKHGLRVPSLHAPANGFLFGQGLYLSDCSSKAGADTQYKNVNVRKDGIWTGLLLLCDAELGPNMLELDSSDPTAQKTCTWYKPCTGGGPIPKDDRKIQKISTLGKGRFTPAGWKDASCVNPALKGVKMPDGRPQVVDDSVSGELQYNEYAIYDEDQIRLRYLFHCEMRRGCTS